MSYVFSDNNVCERRVFSDDSEHLPSATARLAWVRRSLQAQGAVVQGRCLAGFVALLTDTTILTVSEVRG